MNKILKLILATTLLVVIIINFRVSTIRNTISDEFGTNAGQGLLYFEKTRDLTDILKSKNSYSDEWIHHQIEIQNIAFDSLKNKVSCEIPDVSINRYNIDKLLELNPKIRDIIIDENSKLETERNKLDIYLKKIAIIQSILIILLLTFTVYNRIHNN